MASLWGGRFEKDMDEIVKKYNASIFFDQRMYNEDIDGSIAHVTMLGRQGIVSEEEKEQIIAGLKEIKQEIADGKIVKQGTREEIMPEIMGTAAAVGVCSGFTGNDGKEDQE